MRELVRNKYISVDLVDVIERCKIPQYAPHEDWITFRCCCELFGRGLRFPFYEVLVDAQIMCYLDHGVLLRL